MIATTLRAPASFPAGLQHTLRRWSRRWRRLRSRSSRVLRALEQRSLLQRVRLLFLGMSLAALLVTESLLKPEWALAGSLCLAGLAASWIWAYRRRGSPWWAVLPEAGLLFVLVGFVDPADRGLTALFAGAIFHTFLGSKTRTIGAAALFAAAYLAAALGRFPIASVLADTALLALYVTTVHFVVRAIAERDELVEHEQALREVAARLMAAAETPEVLCLAAETAAGMLPGEQGGAVRITVLPRGAADPASGLAGAESVTARRVRKSSEAVALRRFRRRELPHRPTSTYDLQLAVDGESRGTLRLEVGEPLDGPRRNAFELLASFVGLALGRIEHIEEIRRNSRLDPLTGLLNRAGFADHLAGVRARTRRAGTSYALLAIDLDNFKGVNDTYGHSTGDLLLRTLAERLRGAMRAGEEASRLGGDEFVVVLQGVDDGRAEQAADRLLTAIARPLTVAGRRFTLRASVGVATDTGHAEPDAVLHRADEAMYAAKRSGRSRVRLAATERSVPRRPRRLPDNQTVARARARAASA